MMLRASTNYIWDYRSGYLGCGSTCDVYKARHKKDGRECAVKVLHQRHFTQRTLLPYEREVDVMKRLSHDHIVQFIAVEQELSTGCDVLIMELCSGGTLGTMLHEPENAFGLNEEEFLLVLKHVGAGLHYLRRMGIVHRDLKPGNIMRSFTLDGSSIYKLTDFGTARELSDEEHFMSLCGTEEYLHPDIYAVALMHTPHEKQFSARVDLWSLGVTLYQVATGDLPFKPYGGRHNRETMHVILSEKKPGIISGVQKVCDGPIIWDGSLPHTSHLSRGLQEEITPLIAGLLELHPQSAWTFDHVFSAMQRVSSLTIVHVYSVAQMELLRLYLTTGDSRHEGITKSTGVAGSEQLLLYDGELLCQSTSLPRTTSKTPVFLFSMSPQQVPSANINFEFPRLGEDAADLSADLAVAENYRRITAALQWHVKDASLKLRLTHIALHMFIKTTKRETEVHLKDTSELRCRVWQTLKQAQTFLSTDVGLYTRLLSLLLAASPQCTGAIHSFIERSRDRGVNVEHASKELKRLSEQTFSDPGADGDRIESARRGIDSEVPPKWKERVAVQRRQIDEFYDSVKRLRQKSRLDYNERRIHEFERTRLAECSRRLLDLAEDCLESAVPNALQHTDQAIKTILDVRIALSVNRKMVDGIREAEHKLSLLLDETHLEWSSEVDGRLQPAATMMQPASKSENKVDKETETNQCDLPVVSKDRQTVLRSLISLRSLEDQSSGRRLSSLVDETQQLIQRTAEALLTPKVLVGISHDDYESLASSVIFSLCDSGLTRATPSVDTRLHRSSTNDNSGAGSGQCGDMRPVSGSDERPVSGSNVRPVTDMDHGDFEADQGGTEDPRMSGLPDVRTSAVTPGMSLILPDVSLSDGMETKTPPDQTTSSDDSWVMPSM